MDGVMREILDETIPADRGAQVTESGRTFCGDEAGVRGPLARFPRAVELASCPFNARGGTWHTHVTKDQLRTPTNSLPDTANVIFGEIDVSAVVGTQSVDVVVAPADHEAGIAAFREAVGVDVDSTDDVVDAIIGGRITQPADARGRVRHQLGALFETRHVNFGALDRRIEESGIPAHAIASFEMVDAQHHAVVAQQLRDHGKNGDAPRCDPREPAQYRRFARAHNRRIKEKARDLDVERIVAQQTISRALDAALSGLL